MIRRLDWPALLGIGAYLLSWRLATIYQGTDEYWLALRLSSLGLLLTIVMYALIAMVMLWRRAPASLAAKLIWLVLVALETNEVWIYTTCRLLNNALLDEAGNRIGEMEMAEIWGVTVEKMACSRLIDLPPDLMSWIGGAAIVAIIIGAWWGGRRVR